MTDKWNFVNEGILPNIGERVLVSNGDTVLIATLLESNTNDGLNWLFDYRTDSVDTYKVVIWQHCPVISRKTKTKIFSQAIANELKST